MVDRSLYSLLFTVRVTAVRRREVRNCTGSVMEYTVLCQKFEYSVYCVSVLCNLCCTVSVSVRVWSTMCVQFVQYAQ